MKLHPFYIYAAVSVILSACAATDKAAPPNPEAAAGREVYSGRLSERDLQAAQEKDMSFECESQDNIIRGSVRLPAHFNAEDGKTWPAVILAHGILGDRNQGGIFTALADELEKQGIVSFRFDFDGYGESGGSLKNNSILTETADIKNVFDYVRSLDYIDAERISITGFSMGGAAASLAAADLGDSLHSLVLWAPAAVLVD